MRPATVHRVLPGAPLVVSWRDGSSLPLHEVLHHGSPSSRLRAVRQAGQWVVIDLLRLQPDLRFGMGDLPPSDWPGLIYYTLRLSYQGAADFLQYVPRGTESIGAAVAGETDFITAAV